MTRKKSTVTTKGKFVLSFIVLAVLTGLYFAFQEQIQGFATKAKRADVITVGVVTWPGYVAGQYMNDGFEVNEESRFFKEYGILVEFKILDDFLASRKAFESGEVDLLWCTVDALPTEMERAGTMALSAPKFIFQADWSRGGDAIVGRMGIKTVADLRGKTVAVAEGTPSHSFLIELLATANMTLDDVKLNAVPSAIDAANIFKQQAVDAAVVWSPDDIDCIEKVNGSTILSSTKTATHIIADGFIAKESYINDNQEKLLKLYEGWMVGAMELNGNINGARQKAASILASKFQMRVEDALASMENVRFTTHGDNIDFFGIGRKSVVTGDALYTKMSGVYQRIGMVKQPLLWRDVSNISIIQAAEQSGKLAESGHAAEQSRTFAEVKDEDQSSLLAFSSKKVSINFPSGHFTLSDDAKYTIQKEFVDIARTYGGARIRIEGNTDNTGALHTNMDLSYKRARSVADYLITDFQIDKSRILVVGNGPKQAIEDGVEGGNEEYRRTDFQLLNE